MKLCLILSVALLIAANAASASVGGVGLSDTTSSLQQGSLGSADPQVVGSQQFGTQIWDVQPLFAGTPAQVQSGSGSSPSEGDASLYPAPQVGGPVEEQLTANDLGLSLPQMDGFSPSGDIGFVSVSSPGSGAGSAPAGAQSFIQFNDRSREGQQAQPFAQLPAQPSVQTAATAYNAWHYPASLTSANRFYVQTSSGLRTIGGCGLGGYLPIWADIKASGNFFVYEWYPGRSSPYVQRLGWTGTGWKKGWFGGDVPGWHILCYNSGFWSNYIYIYVYPYYASSGYPVAAAAQAGLNSLPQGAPTPPNPGGEGLIMPDFSLYQPQSQVVSGYNYPTAARSGQQVAEPGMPISPGGPAATLPTDNPIPTGSTIPGTFISNPAASSGFQLQSAETCTTCTSSTLIAGGVSSSSPYGASLPASVAPALSSAPAGYAPQSYNSIYPIPSVCRCNEYYVQRCPGDLKTVAGVFCGEWLPLWSKISRPGIYWSFEWKICGSGWGQFCAPDVRNFGYKGAGWYQTWFKGDDLGWHILSYHSNDWSNYIYIYVWPDE
ncbi:MAG: hypothetical protein MUE87_00475 [Methanothrix sp.]|nr:hypothetical protein [Methanothrix sp.]